MKNPQPQENPMPASIHHVLVRHPQPRIAHPRPIIRWVPLAAGFVMRWY
jgi:hypothetical protein